MTETLKVDELEGRALNYAVGMSIFQNPESLDLLLGPCAEDYKPSEVWSDCGQLIEADGIEFRWVSDGTIEAYSYTLNGQYGYGPNHLIAACRLIVKSKFGDTVDIPRALLETSS